MPSADKKQIEVPAAYPTLSDGVANPRKIVVNYNNNYAKTHEIAHADHQFGLFQKIFSRLSDWSKNYQPGWFNNRERPAQALLDDYQKNIQLASDEYLKEYKQVQKYHDELLPARAGSPVLFGPEMRGSAVSGIDGDGRPLPWEQAYVLNDKTDEWSLVFKDGDEKWRKDATDHIDAYRVVFRPQTTGDDPEIPCVPAPLPILGLGVIFRYSRLLRRKSKRLRIISNRIHLDGVRTSPFT